MSRFRYVVADVFTDTPLQGNQVAVFTDAREIPEDRLQPIAREMNYSETVFVYKPEGDGHARIRIFTPTIEMPFAGHPILGTAFILSAPLSLEEIKLETGAGLVPVRLERADGRIVFGRMEQPLPTVEAFDGTDRLLDILGVAQAELPVELYDNGARHYVVALSSASTASPARAGSGRAECSLRGAVWPRIRRPGRRPGRWHCTSPATGESRSARRSRSRRAPRSAARRSSTPASTAPQTR